MKYLEKIVLALDLGEMTDTTLNRAVDLAKTFDSTLLPVHAIEYVPYYPYEFGISKVYEEMTVKIIQ